jgi:hypothetical protein
MGIPVVLFGAFDRHNFGDLLFPHVAAALLPRRDLVFAGLAERDLRGYGGHAVAALSRLAPAWIERPAILIHVGGEILTCEAWQAAVMLLPPDEAQPTIAYFERRPAERRKWVQDMIGTTALAPYVVSRRMYPGLSRVIYSGVGGVGLDQVDATLRNEVLAALRPADAVSVRDRHTRAQLVAQGIAAQLLPDPAVMVADLFGAKISMQARKGEVAQMRQAFPRGYMAVQFSAEFSDDQSLMQMAAQLEQVATREGLGVVLFRAGAAPWHDELACLDQVAASMKAGSAQVFGSLDLWDICALIASSRAYCGSSLHGRIVAMAFALPRVNFRHPASTARLSKQAAFAATWDETGMPADVDLRDIAAAVHKSLTVDKALLQQTARRLVGQYRQGFMALCQGLP